MCGLRVLEVLGEALVMSASGCLTYVDDNLNLKALSEALMSTPAAQVNINEPLLRHLDQHTVGLWEFSKDGTEVLSLLPLQVQKYKY